VAIALAAVATVFLVTTLSPGDGGPPAGALPPGTILYGEWDQRTALAHWYPVATDGSRRTDLGIDASCASWFPDGSRILVTNDAVFTSTSPLRPAVIEPDGSNLRPLDAIDEPDLNLGCGDVAPDGTRIVLEGFGNEDDESNGIYTVRASDGGDLVRLTTGFDGPPSYSPDGSQVVFMPARILRTGPAPCSWWTAAVRSLRLGDVVPRQRLVPGRRVILFSARTGASTGTSDGSRVHRIPGQFRRARGKCRASWSPDAGGSSCSGMAGGD
jgi:Tol biopolymer transport system component